MQKIWATSLLLSIFLSFLPLSCAPRKKARPLTEFSQHKVVPVLGSKIHYLETGPKDAPTVLLLHGGRFTKETWARIGTPMVLAEAGFRVLALDLPGFGASEVFRGERGEFLEGFMERLDLSKTALVSPSMSGSFSLPFVAKHPEKLWAFVPIAPVAVPGFREKLAEGGTLKPSPVPALVVWGEKDRLFPASGAAALGDLFQKSEVNILAGASHPCYLDRPREFHASLLRFLKSLRG